MPSFQVAIFGHSWAFLSHSGSANGNEFIKLWGVAHGIQSKMSGDVIFPRALNFGVAGCTTQDMIANQPAAIAAMKAAGCTLVVIPGTSTNDRTSDFTVARSKQNVAAILQGFKRNGIDVVMLSEAPRGGSSGASSALTGQRLANHIEMVKWQLEELSKICTVVDIFNPLVDISSGGAYLPKDGIMRDGLHLSEMGAELVGRLTVGAMRKYVPVGSAGELIDLARTSGATFNTNPALTGTAGTMEAGVKAEAGSVVATGWNASGENFPATGLTTVWYKEKIGLEEYQCVRIRGQAPADNFPVVYFQQDQTIANLGASDTLQARATDLISHGTGLIGVGLEFVISTSKAFYLVQDGDVHDAARDYPSYHVRSCRLTPKYIHDTTVTNNLVRSELRITLKKGAAIDVVIKVGNLEVMKMGY